MEKPDKQEEFLTLAEIAVKLKYSVKHVQNNWKKMGIRPYQIQAGKRPRFLWSEVRAQMLQQK